MIEENGSTAVLEDALPDEEIENGVSLEDAAEMAEDISGIHSVSAGTDLDWSPPDGLADIPDAEPRTKPDIGTMEIHPLCAIYPEMTQDEKYRLLIDVMGCKRIEETIITFEGQILDGRHRREAIMEAWNRNVDVAFTTRVFDPFTEGDPSEFVARKNGIRRMMDKGQEAVIALKFRDRMIEEAEGGKKSKKSKKVGDEQLGSIMKRVMSLVGCGERYVRMAAELRDIDPKAIDDVYNGNTTLTKAYKAAKHAQEQANPKQSAGSGGTVGDVGGWETSHNKWVQDGLYLIWITEKEEANGATTFQVSVSKADEPNDIDTAHSFDSFDVTSNLKEAKRKGVEACTAHAEKADG